MGRCSDGEGLLFRHGAQGGVEAQQLFGGYGYMRDTPVEKWIRDARVGPIYDFTNEMLRLNHILPAIAMSTAI